MNNVSLNRRINLHTAFYFRRMKYVLEVQFKTYDTLHLNTGAPYFSKRCRVNKKKYIDFLLLNCVFLNKGLKKFFLKPIDIDKLWLICSITFVWINSCSTPNSPQQSIARNILPFFQTARKFDVELLAFSLISFMRTLSS